MRLRSVALFTMLAVSFISTMKVDWPRARSSFAPTRVKMRSTIPISALAAGDEAAHLRHQHNQRDLADVSRFSRHVGSGDNGEPHFAIERGVIRDKLFFHQILIEHGMSPVFDREPER